MFDDKHTSTLLRILLDSESLKSEGAKKLLSFTDNTLFEFVSLGSSTDHTVAQVSFGNEEEWYAGNITINKLTAYTHSGYTQRTGFGYRIADIKRISEAIDIKYGDLILVYILKALVTSENESKTIRVTERKKLLNRQNWIKGGFPRLPAHSILSPEEASIFIDLHCKRNGRFIVAPNFYTSRSLWYLYSLKTKLVSYQPAWSALVFDQRAIPDSENLVNMTASLGDRITDMLIAIDEIGANYYAGVNNDTQDAIIYHFNYWITLFTGVLDSLAWISKYRYQIEFPRHERIGLRTSRHEEFTILLFAINSKIKEFLSNNSSVINLMYDPRDLVIHRERLSGIQVSNQNDNLDFNMVRIPAGFFRQVVQLSKEEGKTLGKWGHYRLFDQYFLEPYRFVRKATAVLIDFTNEYLELLDFSEYDTMNPKLKERIEDNNKSKQHKDFLWTLELFAKSRLGF